MQTSVTATTTLSILAAGNLNGGDAAILISQFIGSVNRKALYARDIWLSGRRDLRIPTQTWTTPKTKSLMLRFSAKKPSFAEKKLGFSSCFALSFYMNQLNNLASHATGSYFLFSPFDVDMLLCYSISNLTSILQS